MEECLSRSGPRNATEITPSNKSLLREILVVGDSQGPPLSMENRDADREKDTEREGGRKTETAIDDGGDLINGTAFGIWELLMMWLLGLTH